MFVPCVTLPVASVEGRRQHSEPERGWLCDTATAVTTLPPPFWGSERMPLLSGPTLEALNRVACTSEGQADWTNLKTLMSRSGYVAAKNLHNTICVRQPVD